MELLSQTSFPTQLSFCPCKQLFDSLFVYSRRRRWVWEVWFWLLLSAGSTRRTTGLPEESFWKRVCANALLDMWCQKVRIFSSSDFFISSHHRKMQFLFLLLWWHLINVFFSQPNRPWRSFWLLGSSGSVTCQYNCLTFAHICSMHIFFIFLLARSC
jgi:hypothetical protein